MHIIMFLLHAG